MSSNPDFRIDTSSLFREENYTDLRVGSIRVLHPVGPDGAPDASRATLFVAQAQLMTQLGPVPVQAEIAASTLAEAIERFPEAMNGAVEQLVEEAKELRRREASRIIHPGEIRGGGPKIIE